MQEVGKMTTLRLGGAAILAIVAMLLCADGRRALSEERGQKAAALQATCPRSDFRVVIDVGHTEAVAGAMSARGVPEYTFNLNLAQDVKQALVSAGFDKTVLLITSKAPFLGLFERAIRANAMAANLFISIHHNSVPDYLLQTWQYDGQDHHFNDFIRATRFSFPIRTATGPAVCCSASSWAPNCRHVDWPIRPITSCRSCATASASSSTPMPASTGTTI